MAGLKCNGGTIKSADSRLSKAYCEGMAYRASDTALNAPKTDNPFATTNESENSVAWDAGWDAADGAGGTITGAIAGCCALRGATVA